MFFNCKKAKLKNMPTCREVAITSKGVNDIKVMAKPSTTIRKPTANNIGNRSRATS